MRNKVYARMKQDRKKSEYSVHFEAVIGQLTDGHPSQENSLHVWNENMYTTIGIFKEGRWKKSL